MLPPDMEKVVDYFVNASSEYLQGKGADTDPIP